MFFFLQYYITKVISSSYNVNQVSQPGFMYVDYGTLNKNGNNIHTVVEYIFFSIMFIYIYATYPLGIGCYMF